MNTTQARSLTRYRLKYEMWRRRLYQDDVAARCGVTQTTVSRVINRDSRVSPEKAARVFAALDALFAEYPPLNTRPKKDGAAA
jgi:transcriptional regulator with XRE-family HTH domain